MKETKAPLVGELSPQVTEGFAEFPTINLLMLFSNSSNPSDLAVLGHLPYRGGVGVLSFIVVCKHVKIASHNGPHKGEWPLWGEEKPRHRRNFSLAKKEALCLVL